MICLFVPCLVSKGIEVTTGLIYFCRRDRGYVKGIRRWGGGLLISFRLRLLYSSYHGDSHGYCPLKYNDNAPLSSVDFFLLLICGSK